MLQWKMDQSWELEAAVNDASHIRFVTSSVKCWWVNTTALSVFCYISDIGRSDALDGWMDGYWDDELRP